MEDENSDQKGYISIEEENIKLKELIEEYTNDIKNLTDENSELTAHIERLTELNIKLKQVEEENVDEINRLYEENSKYFGKKLKFKFILGNF